MNNDNMQAFSGIAQSYSEMPLSILHQLQSVLTEEIKSRLELFGVNSCTENSDDVLGGVAKVEAKQTVFSSGKLQEKSHCGVKLTVLKGGLK